MDVETQGEGKDEGLSNRETQPVVATEDSLEQRDDPGTAEPDVVTDELALAREEAEGVEEDETQKAEKTDKDDGEKKSGRDRTRFLEDGKYEITREDGTKIVLDEDEVRRIARRKTDRMYKQVATERAAREALERQVQQQSGPSAEQLADKPWLAKGAAAPRLEDFEDPNDALAARDEWSAAQRAPDAGEAAQLQQLQRLQADVSAAAEDGKERFQDFQEKVFENPNLPFDVPMIAFLTQSADDHAGVMYHLATHPEDALAIRQALATNERQALKLLARAEAAIEFDHTPGDDAGEGTRTTVPAAKAVGTSTRISKAPEPISPVKGGAAPGRSDPATQSYEDYKKRRLAQRR